MRSIDPQDPAVTYAAVLDALPIVAYMARPDGVISYLSRGWERFTGNLAREVLEQGYHVVIHPDDLPGVVTAWDAARRIGEGYRDDFRVRFGDGSYRWVLSQADPVRARGGAITGWFGTLTDVHDLRVAEEAMQSTAAEASLAHGALLESEERHRVFSEALPGIAWTATPDGELDFLGAGFPGLRGRPQETALGSGWLASVHPDDREDVRRQWNASLASGAQYDVQFRVRMGDGSYRWQLVRALPQRDASGAILRWVGVNIDIEDQRRADEAREQFVRLVEASDDFIGISRADGNATYVNAAGRRMVDIGSLEDARKVHLMQYFLPEDRPFVEREILPAVERDGRWSGDFRLRNFRTGAAVPVSYTVFSLLDNAGRRAGIATVSRDLRARLRLDAGLRALAETGSAMFRSLDFEQTLRNVAEAVTRSFATFSVIDIVDDAGRLRRVATAHSDPALQAVLERAAAARGVAGDHPVARAFRDGVATLVADVPSDWPQRTGMSAGSEADVRRLGVRSAVYAPIYGAQGEHIIGVLTCIVDADDPRGGYTEDDLRFAEELARRAGLAVDHARAYERERRIAVTLQDASLSKTLPKVDHLHLSAEYRPGNDEATIGGDWYDAFLLDDGRVAMTLGDVLGNGLRAAVTMGKVRQAMRAVATVLPEPNAMLDVADHTVRGESDDTYATALAGIFDPARREYTFASAGHPGPALRHPDGRVEEFSSPGILLGLREPGETGTITVAVPPGTVLVFYTDGLIEATRDVDEGHRRLHAAMADAGVAAAANPAHALVEHVLGGRPATDDIAVLVAEVGPSARFDLAPG